MNAYLRCDCASVENQTCDKCAVRGYVASLTRELEEARKALKPFSVMAGELFARNWNASDVVTALDAPDAPCRVTAGDFFCARQALGLSRDRSDSTETEAPAE